MNTVLIVDPRGVIPRGGSDVLERHLRYKESLEQTNKQYTLKIISHAQRGSKDSYRNLIDCEPSFIKFLRKLRSDLLNGSVSIIVCGDPWESYWTVALTQKLMRTKKPVQVQLHGDIGNPSWKRMNVRNFLRQMLSGIALNSASQIRTVSSEQRDLLIKSWPKTKDKSFVASVPYLSETQLSEVDFKSKPRKSLGYVGRLHSDRGIDQFIEIAKLALNHIQDIKIEIVGAGPSEAKLKRELSPYEAKKQITFHGHLTKNQMKEAWNRIGVLISTPKAESFGRAVREALIRGIPVLATHTSGIQSIQNRVGNDFLRTFSDTTSEGAILKDIQDLIEISVPLSKTQFLYQDEENSLQTLIQHWINNAR